MQTLTHDPTVETREEIPYVGTRRAVTMDTMGLIADRIGELVGLVLGAGQTPAGPPFLRYVVIDMERELLVEAGIPVAGPVPTSGDVYSATLPAGRFVTVVHHGHPDTLIGATADLLQWSADQGLVFDAEPSPEGDRWGCRLENYLTNPADEHDMNAWDTELAFRLAD